MQAPTNPADSFDRDEPHSSGSAKPAGANGEAGVTNGASTPGGMTTSHGGQPEPRIVPAVTFSAAIVPGTLPAVPLVIVDPSTPELTLDATVKLLLAAATTLAQARRPGGIGAAGDRSPLSIARDVLSFAAAVAAEQEIEILNRCNKAAQMERARAVAERDLARESLKRALTPTLTHN